MGSIVYSSQYTILLMLTTHLHHYPHLSRCLVWLTHSSLACKWRVLLLSLPIYSHCPWDVLCIISNNSNMNDWCNHYTCPNGHSIYRLCPCLRSNKALSRNSSD